VECSSHVAESSISNISESSSHVVVFSSHLVESSSHLEEYSSHETEIYRQFMYLWISKLKSIKRQLNCAL
jgi:hypothetical protein